MIFGLFWGLFGRKAQKSIKMGVGVGADFGPKPYVLRVQMGLRTPFWGGAGAPFLGAFRGHFLAIFIKFGKLAF